MNLQPKCFARSRPSETQVENRQNIQLLGERTVHPNLSLVFQITLVGDNDDRERILILHSQDLLVEGADFFERVAGCDRVHKEETLASAHVLLPHGTKIEQFVSKSYRQGRVDQ